MQEIRATARKPAARPAAQKRRTATDGEGSAAGEDTTPARKSRRLNPEDSPSGSLPPASTQTSDQQPATQASTQLTASPPPPPSTQTVTDMAVEVLIPDGVEKWLCDAIAWFGKTDLGPQYTSLLSALVRLEVAFGFDPKTYGALPSDNRPAQVTDWINRGRWRMKKPPNIKNAGAYAEVWATWWDSMQPKWRRRGSDGKWRFGGDEKYGGPEDWGVLDRPGPNGCLSVVGSLFFWGVCEDQSAAVKARWLEAVEDVAWMLEGLEASMKPLKK
ncbi:hypothetical protein C8R47DRAFT_999333 [Mycena vitilis]|nr:hypothetical protein C8R47DRAFT_999333 [Mycena vitilis]